MRPQAQKIVMRHARLRAAVEDALIHIDNAAADAGASGHAWAAALRDIARDLRKALEEGVE